MLARRQPPQWFWYLAGASTLGFGGWMLFQYLFPPDSEANTMALSSVSRVLRRERADGVDQRLQSFLDWWEASGPFAIMVGVDGGVRSLATQWKLYAQGRFTPGPNAGRLGYPLLGSTVTNAASNKTSAHGHRAALDLWPVLDGRGQLDDKAPGVADMYHQVGVAAESQGFQWGGRWTKDKDGINPDLPHIQLPNWRTLPVVA